MSWLTELEARLTAIHAENRFRRRLVVDGPAAAEVTVGGQRLLSFCSNDYLGLANHPRVTAAFKGGCDEFGVGAGASHLITGHTRAHDALEVELAEFVGAPRALLFSTGYMANLAVASALLDRHDLVVEDRLNHASLIDAGLLTRARLRRYPHGDTAAASRLLTGRCGRGLIMTDGVFSMDGDVAPVAALASVCRRQDAALVVDDAHGFGVLGDTGAGTLEHAAQPIRWPVVMMGTLGKALGTFGAFIAADAVVIETLIQRARTYIYTTAPPPAIAAATHAALKVLKDEPGRRQKVLEHVNRFRTGARQLDLPLFDSVTPIQPILVGDSGAAVSLSRALRERGFLIPAIRPPTVPAGSARLRVTFSAAHDAGHVDRLLDALASVHAPVAGAGGGG
ncbi:MAG: 8-amino-7-oxononanoate synthase [Gammaproteobacteria bacterium]|nr:8-amino-7-oxononanoate synthase [Gammaproteobacteria bacterium]